MADAVAHGGARKSTLLFFVSISLCFASDPAGAISFAFNFSGANHDLLGGCYPAAPRVCLQGNALLNQDGVQLTNNEYRLSTTSSYGRAVYAQPVLLWDSTTRQLTDFTTRFSFKIYTQNASQYGDGLAFFLSPFPSQLLPNSDGGWLGLVTPDKPGLFASDKPSNASAFVAVEFDSYRNLWDPSADHIGIDVNSIRSKVNLTLREGIKRPDVANAWVHYNATTHNLSVFLTYDQNPTFSGGYNLSYQLDLREVLPEHVAVGFTGATGTTPSVEKHTLLSWSFSSSLEITRNKEKKKNVGLVVGLTVGAGMAVAGLCLVGFFLVWKRRAGEEEEEEDTEYDATIEGEFGSGRGPKRFPYKELAAATGNFSEEEKLGQGGFGSVYKGRLTDPSMEVAIKRVSRSSRQGKKEYISEVKVISRLRHRNLVQLMGWCHGRGEFLLVYEFMCNGSLDRHIFGKGQGLLPWSARAKIAQGLASALLYLHEEWEQCVVHRDVKSSNVMLDGDFNAKLGDFGLARLVDHERGSQTTVLAGTMGYMAPECATTGRASKESDVYSFGVVILEIACGRRAVERNAEEGKMSLVEWVWGLHGRGLLLEAVDGRLGSEFDEQEMERQMVVGLWCAHPDYHQRPTMRQAIRVLSSEVPPPALPAEMPVPVYSAPSMGTSHQFSYTSTSGSAAATTQVSYSSQSNLFHDSSTASSPLMY